MIVFERFASASTETRSLDCELEQLYNTLHTAPMEMEVKVVAGLTHDLHLGICSSLIFP